MGNVIFLTIFLSSIVASIVLTRAVIGRRVVYQEVRVRAKR